MSNEISSFYIMLCCILCSQCIFEFSFATSFQRKIIAYDWDGFYTGLVLGGQFGRSIDKTGAFGYNANNEKWDYNEAGLMQEQHWVTVIFGINLLQLVIGPEIELGYLRMNGSGAQPDSPGFDTVGKSSSDFYTTFRARLGAVFDRYLVFATVGVIGVN